MALRRGRKEGTIYKRKNGMWRAQLSIEGKRFSHTASSQSDCRHWLQKTHQRVAAGLTYRGSQMTYATFLESWLGTVKSRLRRGTLSQYTNIVKSYIVPEIGRVKLNDLRPDRIQRLYDEMIGKGKSPRTVQITHAVIHRSLTQAVKLGLLPINPDAATTPPKPQHKEMRVLDQSQAQKLLIAAKSKGLKEFVFYFFLLATGVRQGELLGLRWDDIDFVKQTVKIVRQSKPLPGGGFEMVSPKTRNGYRTIRLGFETIKLLQEHYANQVHERKAANDKWQEHNLVFPSIVGGPLNPPNVVRSFRLLLKRAGLPQVRFHDLRHTAASLMLNNGVDVLVVSRRLGHAKASITLDVYGHLIPSTQERAAELIEGLINPMFINPSAPDLHPKNASLVQNP